MNKQIPVLITVALVVAFWGCNPHQKLDSSLGASQILELGKENYQKENYKKAREYFYYLVSFYPGSGEATQGQYLLAKSYYDQGKYDLALLEFELIIDRYPNSEYVDDAYYFIGYCYFNESPDLQRDLGLVGMAIDSFETVILDYQLSNRVEDAKKGLLEARTKLAKKNYYIGKFYLRQDKYQSAEIYFQDIIDNYNDTEFVDDSIFYIGECNQKNNLLENAVSYYQKYLDEYPQGELVVEAKERVDEISGKL